MELTHLDIRTALEDAAFPADGDDLLAVAEANEAGPEVLAALDRLRADETYDSVDEVIDELNVDHTAIDDTTTLRTMLGMDDGDPDPDHVAAHVDGEDDTGVLPSLSG